MKKPTKKQTSAIVTALVVMAGAAAECSGAFDAEDSSQPEPPPISAEPAE